MKSPATSAFFRDHPQRARNVFLMMGFDPSPMRSEIDRLVRQAGVSIGFDVIRADDRDYTGEIWSNVSLCLHNCSLGIAVFDGDDRSAQNLAVELGYLFAIGTPCLLLREASLAPPVTMLAHRLHHRYSAFDLTGSLHTYVHRWLSARDGRPAASRIR